MKKFIRNIERTTLQNCPLSPGTSSFHFLEDPEGIPISEHIEKLFETTNIADIQKRNDLLGLRYIVNIEINSAVEDVETVQDLRFALNTLDKASREYRQSLSPNQHNVELAHRILVNLCIKGLFDTQDYASEFDTCCLDISEESQENVEKGLIYVAQIAQRQNPTTYIISTELANNLSKTLKDTSLGKTLNAKIKMKSVFAKKEGLENPFVRSLN